MLYCSECGSGNLSTPARPEDAAKRALHQLPVIGFPIAAGVVLLFVIVGMVLLIDWTQLVPVLIAFVIMLGGCYWALTFLPPAVRRIGWTAVRRVWRKLRGKSQESQRRR